MLTAYVRFPNQRRKNRKQRRSYHKSSREESNGSFLPWTWFPFVSEIDGCEEMPFWFFAFFFWCFLLRIDEAADWSLDELGDIDNDASSIRCFFFAGSSRSGASWWPFWWDELDRDACPLVLNGLAWCPLLVELGDVLVSNFGSTDVDWKNRIDAVNRINTSIYLNWYKRCG